jgi:DNA adenine methylase
MVGPLSYIGGKNRLAKQIIRLIPEHTTYIEPFAGGAQVFFHKEPSPVEVLNDLDFDVVNFFRVAQRHYEELVRFLRFSLASRKWFELLQAANPEGLTDIERASRFFYLQKNCFGGLIRKRNYHYFLSKRSNFNPARIPEIIEKTHKRLAGVQIEALPYEQILQKFDHPNACFYLDPPYWGPQLYRFNFTAADFHLLADRLEKVKGKFILSLNDRPEVREVFGKFRVEMVELAYTATSDPSERHRELLIMNYRPVPFAPRRFIKKAAAISAAASHPLTK